MHIPFIYGSVAASAIAARDTILVPIQKLFVIVGGETTRQTVKTQKLFIIIEET